MPHRLFEKRKSNAIYLKKKDEEIATKDIGISDESNFSNSMKPSDQLNLTEQELKEEITKVLKASNPSAPDNIDRQYKPVPNIDQTVIHFSLESNLIPKDSYEALQIQRATFSIDDEASQTLNNLQDDNNSMPGLDPDQTFATSHTSTSLKEEEPETAEAKLKSTDKSANHFLYYSRGTQTINDPLQTKQSQTELPPRRTLCDNVSQAVIFDAYLEDVEKSTPKPNIKVNSQPITTKRTSRPIKKLVQPGHETHFDDVTPIFGSLKVLERMLNLNTYDEVVHDLAFYDDPADEYRADGHGTLLPLWRFLPRSASGTSAPATNKMPVTAICWSPFYKDLFFVAYGFYDVKLNEQQGQLCGFTLKNPGHPEYSRTTESSVMCLDLHPTLPRMLCTGLLNGTVLIISIQNENKVTQPCIQLSSSLHPQKHHDCCWQVKWLERGERREDGLSLLSLGGDGRVLQWTINKYELVCQEIMLLTRTIEPNEFSSTVNKVIEAATSIGLHPNRGHTFLVGTLDGSVYLQSGLGGITAAGRDASRLKPLHSLIIYKLAWSPWHSDVFASCSADWLLAIWSCRTREPVLVLDLGSPVSDLAWAPYSSTVLAAVTADRRVRVFDLAVSRLEPLVSQTLGSRKHGSTALTQVAFSDKYHILVVGDMRGATYSVKLSPNLRRVPQVRRGEVINIEEVQYTKLDRVLQILS